MIVYRLETEQGKGVFSSGCAGSCGGPSPYRHPGPREDGNIPIRDLHCGFKSVRQLAFWFNKDQRKRIAERGLCKVSLYEIDESLVNFGKFQVTFPKNKATLTKRVCPTSI